MSKVAIEEREKKISGVDLPVVNCDCLDKDTRKMIVYLIGKELKYLRGFPGDWVQGSEANLTHLKERIEQCSLEVAPRSKKGTRTLSGYQKFMKVCASGKEKGGMGKNFRECIIDWRKTKAELDDEKERGL